MKKIYQQWQWINHSKLISRRKITHRRKKGRKAWRTPLVPHTFVAPEDFCLTTNYEGVVGLFERIGRLLSLGQTVILNMKEVHRLEPDAILYMASQLHEYTTNRAQYHGKLHGNTPDTPEFREMFAESGFYDWVNSGVQKQRTTITNGQFVRLKYGTSVNPALAQSVKKFAADKLGPLDPRFGRTLYETLIECMANSKNHAFGETGIGRWWLLARFNRKQNSVRFIFLDLGLTIPATVAKKIRERIAEAVTEQVSNLTNIQSDQDSRLIMSALNGEHRTRTKQRNRGKGLPMILEAATSGEIANFMVLSRAGRYYEGDTDVLDTPFPGTMLAWDFIAGGSK